MAIVSLLVKDFLFLCLTEFQVTLRLIPFQIVRRIARTQRIRKANGRISQLRQNQAVSITPACSVRKARI